MARPNSKGLLGTSNCCAAIAAAACFKREDDEIDLCNIISDMLRFFKIGFLRKELDLDNRLLSIGDVEGRRNVLSDPDCRGPYNQVTSQSFNLLFC